MKRAKSMPVHKQQTEIKYHKHQLKKEYTLNQMLELSVKKGDKCHLKTSVRIYYFP